jgi:hypothetical protein
MMLAPPTRLKSRHQEVDQVLCFAAKRVSANFSTIHCRRLTMEITITNCMAKSQNLIANGAQFTPDEGMLNECILNTQNIEDIV